MKEYLTISEAAQLVNMTSEALRHYDRIGLVKPSRRDPSTGYRYYSKQDIVLLHTIRALQYMNLPLKEIKHVLEYDDLETIIDFFNRAEENADKKIEELEYCKTKIQSAKTHYEEKLREQQLDKNIFIKEIPKRVILLSDTLKEPAVENLWDYLSNFYTQLNPSLRDSFAFEDTAAIYTQGQVSTLFAVCIRHRDVDGLKVLPAGKYLCADCKEEERESVLLTLKKTALKIYNIEPAFSIQMIVLSGLLQWNYQIQIPLCSN